MEGEHADAEAKDISNLGSIFSLFSELTGYKNENPKYCWSLFKSLRESEFSVGSGSNLEYSVKRLVRGLGSSRLHSQCGCFAALTCVLKYQACPVETVLDVLDKEQRPPQGATKPEMRALTAGCVLTCGAIIHSDLFSVQSSEIQENILKKLIEGGKAKSYLFPVACQFLIDIISSADNETFTNVVWPICESEIFQDLNDCSPDVYYLLLVCLKQNYKLVNEFLQGNSISPDFLVETILKCLLSNFVKNDHPIYNDLGQYFCMNASLPVKVWTECVNENAKVNMHKDSVLIAVFYYIIKNLQEATVVPKLLVSRFLEIFIKVLSIKRTNKANEDSNDIAKPALNSLINLLSGEGTSEETKFQSIKKLLFYPANLKFEMKTGTKCISILVSQLSCEFVKKLLDIYRQVINGEIKKKIDEDGTEENWNSKEKQHALHVFTKNLNHPSVKKEIHWKLDEIKFIFEISFLNKFELPSEVQKCAKDCFYKAIMMQMPSLKELIVFLDELALYINGHIKTKEFKISSEDEKFWDQMYSVVEILKKKINNKLYSAVHVLLIYMGVHLFVDSDLAKKGIEELLSCYQHLKETQKKKKCDNENAPHWTEVTVDLILSLLSRENRLWRHVISCVFPQIVSQITPTALQQIIDALDPKSQNSVLVRISSDESDTESGEKTESSLSEASDTDSERDDEGKPNDQLRLAVRNALGYSAAHTDDDSMDMDQMNEEEEKKLNESLSEAFRQFKSRSQSRKKKQSKEEEALTHFRLRVLDLVEIYLTNSPSVAGCLDLLHPLLDLLELSIKDHHQRPLQNRVDSILKHFSTVKTFSSTENVTQTIIKNVFQSVISRKETSSLIFVEMSPRISNCTAFLVRCSQHVPNDDATIPLVTEYDFLLKSFFQSRDLKLPISMFQAVLRMSWMGNFKIVATLFDLLISSSVRIFKKVKIMELLRIFYKNDRLHFSCDDSSKSELTEIENNFICNFINLLSDYEKNKHKLTEKIHLSFFSNVISLINLIQSSLKKHRASFHPKNISLWKTLICKMADTEIIINNKRTRSQLGNLAFVFKIELPPKESTGRKRTLSETSNQSKCEDMDESEGKERKKKKRKLSAEKRKLMKESRMLREEISSNGLGMVRFSTVDFQSWHNLEAQDDDETDMEEPERETPKKKRRFD